MREYRPTSSSHDAPSTDDTFEPGRHALAEREHHAFAGWEDLEPAAGHDDGASLAHFHGAAGEVAADHVDHAEDVEADHATEGGEEVERRAEGDATAEEANEQDVALAEAPAPDAAAVADTTARAAEAPAPAPAGNAPMQAPAAADHDGPIPLPKAADGAHDDPYERVASKATAYYAKQDRYNRRELEDNVFKSKYHVARPGVRVGEKKGKPKSGRDLFTLTKDEATRYTFVRQNGKDVARAFDTIKKSQLTVVNFKFTGEDAPPGKTRLLLNPVAPRRLQIGTSEATCVLSWVGGKTAAWIPVADLKMPGHDRADILRAVRSHAKRKKLNAAPASIPTVHFVFRPKDAVGHADAIDRDGRTGRGPLKLGPNNGNGGNEVNHYLGKTLGNNTLYPVSGSLPQRDNAVVSYDTALPGDHFFVPKDSTFVREVGVFEQNQKKTARRQTWVYGFIGKQAADGSFVADRSRPGWVPLRSLLPFA